MLFRFGDMVLLVVILQIVFAVELNNNLLLYSLSNAILIWYYDYIDSGWTL